MSRKIFLLVLMIFHLFVVTGCNTLQGMGKDIEKAGEALQKAGK